MIGLRDSDDDRDADDDFMLERSKVSFINTVFEAATIHKIINIQMSDPPPPVHS